MSEPIRKVLTGAIIKDAALNDRQIRVIASDPTPDRVGDVMVPGGCSLEQFNGNPIVLANHDPTKPIGTAHATIKSKRVEALITFAPPRISAIADEFCGLAKAGVLNAVSAGFSPIECEPISGGGVQYNKWELLELSIVAVPANPSAVVIERSLSRTRRFPSPTEWPRDLTKKERTELNIRNAIRAEGLTPLSDEGRKAYLRVEFPDLDEREALREYVERTSTMTGHEWFLERKRQSDFAKRYARIGALRQEIREQIARAVVETSSPFYGATAAEFCANVRALDQQRFTEAARKWRS